MDFNKTKSFIDTLVCSTRECIFGRKDIYVPQDWKTIVLKKSEKEESQLMFSAQKDALGFYVLYSISPNDKTIFLSGRIDN